MNVVFDFDRTLTLDDTTYAFYVHAARSNDERARMRNALIRRRLRLLSRARFKSLGVDVTLRGRTLTEVVEVARSFAPHVDLRAAVVDKLQAHVARGDAVFVATASLEEVARAVLSDAGLMNGVAALGSTLALDDDARVRGVDVMCEGRRKVGELWRRHGVPPDVVYTDGRGDLALVRAAREAHLVIAGRIVRVR